MTTIAAYASAGLGLVKRDALLFVTYRGQVVGRILSVLVALTMFFYISQLVRVGGFASPDAYFAFVLVGLLVMQILQSTFGVPTVLRQELVAGTFERLVASPFGPVASVLAMLIFPFVQAMVTALLIVALGLALFDLPVAWSTAWLAPPVAVLAACAFAAFGLLFAAMVIVFKQATGVSWVVTGLSLVAGIYFPVALLPEWVQWTSQVQPFTPALDLLRHLLVGMPLKSSAEVDIARLAGFAAVLLPASVWVVHIAVRLGRRRGTLAEY